MSDEERSLFYDIQMKDAWESDPDADPIKDLEALRDRPEQTVITRRHYDGIIQYLQTGKPPIRRRKRGAVLWAGVAIPAGDHQIPLYFRI